MTEREQTLLSHCCRLQKRNRELREANENLRVAGDAADVLLGAAMDQLLTDSDHPKRRP
jgi:hypothetical protein